MWEKNSPHKQRGCWSERVFDQQCTQVSQGQKCRVMKEDLPECRQKPEPIQGLRAAKPLSETSEAGPGNNWPCIHLETESMLNFKMFTLDSHVSATRFSFPVRQESQGYHMCILWVQTCSFPIMWSPTPPSLPLLFDLFDMNQTFFSTLLWVTGCLICLYKPRRWLCCQTSNRVAVCELIFIFFFILFSDHLENKPLLKKKKWCQHLK